MIRVRQIKVSILDDNIDVLKKKVSHKLKVNISEINNYKIIKKSIDARDKNNIYYVYEVDVCVSDEDKILKRNKSNDILMTPIEEYKYEILGNKAMINRPIIIGSGPSGLFCAYILAEAGYNPLILERGERIEDRINTVEEFFKNNKLNVNSNIQFGEGGAGTFSDGKLNTLVKDKYFRGKRVFEIFVENGAPEEIMYLNKPHIGTDILRKVIINIRNKIINMGGDIRYNSLVTDLVIDNGKMLGVKVNDEEIIKSNVVVLAIGHSSRDTFYMLHDRNVSMKSKNFAVGLRIMHPQEMISKSQYGDNYKLLEPASYKLTYKSSNNRGVYSFCMCPGGFVVNASSEENRLVVNGMSNYKRDEVNANSAIVVTVNKNDFGDNLFGGVEFQRRLEEKAYSLGSGLIPIQLFKDYKDNVSSTKLGEVIPNTKGNYRFSNLNELFNSDITDSLIEGINYFGTKIKGFDRDDAVLFGVESRTSSPITIERDSNGVSNILGLYPCGEGAGYAGGITTSAIDGLKIAEDILRKYKI